jgi:hypothetical protein
MSGYVRSRGVRHTCATKEDKHILFGSVEQWDNIHQEIEQLRRIVERDVCSGIGHAMLSLQTHPPP